MRLRVDVKIYSLGARHLYLMDYVGENLPNLKESIESKYPDVKVCRTMVFRVLKWMPLLSGDNDTGRCRR